MDQACITYIVFLLTLYLVKSCHSGLQLFFPLFSYCPLFQLQHILLSTPYKNSLILINLLTVRFVPEQAILMMNMDWWPSFCLQKDSKTCGKDVGFSFGSFETTHVLPSRRLAPDITAFHWVPPTRKGMPLTQVWTLIPSFSLCFKNNDEHGKTLGYLPLKSCNCKILYIFGNMNSLRIGTYKLISSPPLM